MPRMYDPIASLQSNCAQKRSLLDICADLKRIAHDIEPEERGRPITVKDCGTLASYRRGCKCGECKAANAAYYRNRRKRSELTT